MKKHFLLLLWMTLLPLAGWAAELTVKYATGSPYEKTVTYEGDALSVPLLTVKSGNTVLESSTEYTSKLYTNEQCTNLASGTTQVGTYYLKVFGVGNYDGDLGDNILILKVEKASLTLTLRNQSREYKQEGYTDIPAKYFFDNVEGLKTGDDDLYDNITISNADEFVNAGTYDVNLSIPSAVTKNYTIQYAGVQTPKLTINKANASVTTAPAAVNPPFTGDAQPLVSAGVATGGTINYSLDGVNYSDAIPTGTNAVDYTVYYKVVGDQNHNDTQAASISATIEKADASVTGLTAKADLTYDGSGQALVDATNATVTGGTINYSLDGVNYSDAIPTGTNAGEYTVSYKVVGDNNHNDTQAASFTATIEKANASVTTAPAAVNNLTYTGGAQPLVSEGVATGGTINYSLDGVSYSDAIPTGTNAGDYTVSYKVVGDANHNDTPAASFTATIEKANVSVTTAPEAENLTYTGGAQPLVSTGVATGGTFNYSLDGENYSADIPTGTNAGPYTVSYKVVGDANHNDTEAASIDVTIAQKSIANATITIAAGTKVYKNAPWEPAFTVKDDQTTLTAGTDYEVTNNEDDFNGWSNNINAGTASVKVRGIGNYKDVTEPQTFKISQKTIPNINWIKKLTFGDQDYTGTQIKPEFVWQPYEGEDLTDHVDVTYGANINAGTGTVTIKAKDNDTNYSGFKTIDFNIVKAPLTVTAKDITVGYGVPYTPAIDSYSETKNNEDPKLVVTGNPSYTYYSDENCSEEVNKPTAVGAYWYKVSGLTAQNYELSYAPAKIVITNGDLNAQVKDQEIVYGQKFNLTGALKHISGLSVNETEAFNATDFSAATWTVKNHDTQAIVSDDYNGEYLDAGTYDVSVSNVSYTNYNVAVAAGTWTVKSKDIAQITLGELDGVDYIGEKVEAPSTEGKFTYTFEDSQEPVTLVKDQDYTVSDEDYANINVVDGGKIKVTGTGNYTGSVEVPFAINKADWTITAQPASFKVNDEASAVYTAEITGLVGQDSEVAGKLLAGESVEGFGTLTVAKANNIGTAVGTYPDGVVATYTGETANYNAPTINYAELKITQGSIVLYVNDATKIYGYEFNQEGWSLDIDAENSDLTAEQASNWKNIVNGEENVVYATEYAQYDDVYDGENKKEYAVNVSNANVLSSTNYAITVNPGKLTLDQQELQLTAQDQTINRGENPDTEVRYEDSVDPEASKTVEAVGRLNNDDLGISIKIAEGKASIVNPEGHVGAIAINTDNLNKNYKLVANVPGTLYVKGTNAIALGDPATDAQTIKDYAGQKVNVTIDFSSRNKRTLGGERKWEKENWVTMTLPFNISVADLSQKLGYAIVNVIDPSKTVIKGTSSEFYGKLTMKGGNGSDEWLVANKPFLVKIADNIADRNGGVIDFGEQIIVAPASEADLSVDAGQDVKFVGTYATKTVTKDDNANIWFMLGNHPRWAYITTTSENSWNIVPFEAYIVTSMTGEAPRNMTFFFEEIDGSTTAIKSIEADNLNSKLGAEGWYTLNGVKLQNAPTQKGVYIKDGKKVVIK